MDEFKDIKPKVGRFINKGRDSMHFILGAAAVTVGVFMGYAVAAQAAQAAQADKPSK